MSRSRKKHGVIKDHRRSSKKFWKKLSNNTLKQHDVQSGCSYKKLVDNYNFCDYYWSEFGTSKRHWYYVEYPEEWGPDMFTLHRK